MFVSLEIVFVCRFGALLTIASIGKPLGYFYKKDFLTKNVILMRMRGWGKNCLVSCLIHQGGLGGAHLNFG